MTTPARPHTTADQPVADDAIGAQILARLDHAVDLHTIGRCVDARAHAVAAWAAACEHFAPDDPEQALTGLLAGLNTAYLLGACHHHRHAVDVLTTAAARYHHPDASPGAADRTRRWHNAARGFALRGHQHRGAHHRDDACRGAQHRAEVVAAIAVLGRTAHHLRRGATATPDVRHRHGDRHA